MAQRRITAPQAKLFGFEQKHIWERFEDLHEPIAIEVKTEAEPHFKIIEAGEKKISSLAQCCFDRHAIDVKGFNQESKLQRKAEKPTAEAWKCLDCDDLRKRNKALEDENQLLRELLAKTLDRLCEPCTTLCSDVRSDIPERQVDAPMTEWKSVPELDLEVNRDGLIRSLTTKRNRKTTMVGKYHRINHTQGSTKHMFLHRIVAEAFLTKPSEWNESWTIDHIDRNPSNNCVDNLRWASIEMQVANRGPARPLSPPPLEPAAKRACIGNGVIACDKNGTVIASYPSAQEAHRRSGIDRTSIVLAARSGGSAGGYTWKRGD